MIDMSFSTSSASSSSTAVSSPSSTATSWFSGIVRGRTNRSGSVKMTNNSSEHNAGPIKAKNQFRGVLFKYGPKPIQVRFD
jgi:exo-beta-1,3-glucanase (GH17 family)